MKSLADVAWSMHAAAEALEALARAAHLPLAKAGESLGLPELHTQPERFERWLELMARSLGLEAEPVTAAYAEVDLILRGSAPSLVRLPEAPPERCLIALLGGRGRRLRALAPDLSTHSIDRDAARGALVARIEQQYAAEVEASVAAAQVAEHRLPAVRAALLRSRLSAHSVTGIWLLRVPPSAPFGAQLGRIHAVRQGLGVLLAHAVAYALSIAGWWLVGGAAVAGRLDRGALFGWALLLLTQIPLALFVATSQARLAIDLGALLKQRLLAGVLNLSPESVRTHGAGQLFGRVLESEAVEALAQGPGQLCVIAVIELAAALIVLGFGAAGALLIALLLAWLAVSLLLGVRYYRARRAWTVSRIGLTHDLIERMQGHRTRLAQRPRERWHTGEDEAVADYIARSGLFDARASQLAALVPRGWLLLGVAGFAWAFVTGTASPAALATSLGGVLLAFRALHRLVLGAPSFAGAALAWREIGPIFRAAAAGDAPGAPELELDTGLLRPDPGETPSLLEARELVFRHREIGPAVLRGCSLEIRSGDRILLGGPSGGGKSTLASLLCGLRAPEAGTLLVGGLDRNTLGSRAWRRRVVQAPQFHENHVLSASFAFNLLMGRAWPASAADLRAATDVCHELGLGELLGKMPAGLQQMVGETGWQLSHGERSRVYVVRALLQDADVLIFDESFAALDPHTLELTLACVLRRAKSLLVIAHP